jgi:hypothetical protein
MCIADNASNPRPYIGCNDIDASSAVLQGLHGECNANVAVLNDALTRYAFGYPVGLSCSPSGLIKASADVCDQSSIVLTDFVKSVQKDQTIDCPQHTDQFVEYIYIKFDVVCPMTETDLLLTKLAIANTIADSNLLFRNNITNMTLQCDAARRRSAGVLIVKVCQHASMARAKSLAPRRSAT